MPFISIKESICKRSYFYDKKERMRVKEREKQQKIGLLRCFNKHEEYNSLQV